jgi:hypothetical protein
MPFSNVNRTAKPSEPISPPKIGRTPPFSLALCDEYLALAALGYSIAETITKLCNGDRRLWLTWQREHPAFADAVSRAKDISLAWWEALARNNTTARDFNANLYRVVMAARFPDHGYRERVTVENTPGPLPVDLKALSPEERDALADLLERAAPSADSLSAHLSRKSQLRQ